MNLKDSHKLLVSVVLAALVMAIFSLSRHTGFITTSDIIILLLVGAIIVPVVLLLVSKKITKSNVYALLLTGFFTPIVYNISYVGIYLGNVEHLVSLYPNALIDSVVLAVLSLGMFILIKKYKGGN